MGVPDLTVTPPCIPRAGDLPACVGVSEASGTGGCRGGSFYAVTLLLRETFGMRWASTRAEAFLGQLSNCLRPCHGSGYR